MQQAQCVIEHGAALLMLSVARLGYGELIAISGQSCVLAVQSGLRAVR